MIVGFCLNRTWSKIKWAQLSMQNCDHGSKIWQNHVSHHLRFFLQNNIVIMRANSRPGVVEGGVTSIKIMFKILSLVWFFNFLERLSVDLRWLPPGILPQIVPMLLVSKFVIFSLFFMISKSWSWIFKFMILLVCSSLTDTDYRFRTETYFGRWRSSGYLKILFEI